MVFAALTGLRLNEITHLRWSDVDLERRVLFIRNTDSFTNKGGRDRVVAMNDLLGAMLSGKERKDEYVFSFGHGKMEGSWISHLFKRYVIRAGINPSFIFTAFVIPSQAGSFRTG